MTTSEDSREIEKVERENSHLPSNLELQELNQVSSIMLETILSMAKSLKNAKKIKTGDKSQILGRLVKSYADLVKTHRAVNNLEDEGPTMVNQGVIIIPGKAGDWVSAAKQELDDAKLLIQQAEEVESQPGTSGKAAGRTAGE